MPKVSDDITETALAVAEPPSLLGIIANAAANPAVDVEKMRALLEMQERLERRESARSFNEAFAAMQPHLPRVKKNGEVWYPVEKGKSDGLQYRAFAYPKYEDIDEAVRPILNRHGFWLSYDTEPHLDGRITIVGKLHHRAGHTEVVRFGPAPIDASGGKNNIQGNSSTLTYGQRNCARMLLNLVFDGEDDDGNGGTLSEEQISEIVALLKQLWPHNDKREGADRGPWDRFLNYVKAGQTVEEAGGLELAVGSIQSRNHRAAMSVLSEQVKKRSDAVIDRANRMKKLENP